MISIIILIHENSAGISTGATEVIEAEGAGLRMDPRLERQDTVVAQA